MRLAAFDMDGTLLMPNHQLGDETLASLRALQAKHVVLAFATGRHLQEMNILRAKMSLDAFLITGNGTRIHDPQGRCLFACDLDPAVAERVIHSHWDTSATLHVFNDTGWFTSSAVPEVLLAHQMSGFSYHLIDLRTIPVHQVTKVCFIGDPETLSHLRSQLVKVLGEQAHICFSARDCLEVLPLNGNKGAALRFLSAYLKMSMAECMAFGDAMNDREMLESVGQGFIMANAMSQLKAVLPHLPVIVSCETQGVSHYLNHWIKTPHLAYSPE